MKDFHQSFTITTDTTVYSDAMDFSSLDVAPALGVLLNVSPYVAGNVTVVVQVAADKDDANSWVDLSTVDSQYSDPSAYSSSGKRVLRVPNGFWYVRLKITSAGSANMTLDVRVIPRGAGSQTNITGTVTVDTEFGAAATTDETTETTAPSLVKIYAYLRAWNGTAWTWLRTGLTAVSSTLTGMLNTLPWGVFNTTPTTRSNGQGGPLQTSSSGSLNVNLDALSSAIDSVTNHQGASSSVTGVDTYFSSSLGNTATSIKSSGGNFYGWAQLYNPGGSAGFCQMFDLATGSVTLGTTTPKQSYYVGALGTFSSKDQTVPITHSVAITAAVTATVTGSGAPASNFVANGLYK